MTPSARSAQADADLLHLLDHEIRNPLAALRGCADTLAGGDGLPDEMKARLAQAIARQSRHLEWLLDAAEALLGAKTDPAAAEVDLVEVASEAATLTEAAFEHDGRPMVRGSRSRISLACRALFFGLGASASGLHVFIDEHGRLRATTSAHDLVGGGRRWKLALAQDLLSREGWSVEVTPTESGAVASVDFGSRAQAA
jgi:signal transduction histidine kinase